MRALVVALVVAGHSVSAATPHVTVVELPAQHAVITTVRATPAELESALTIAFVALVAACHQRGLELTGPPFARYVSRGHGDNPRYTVEAGLVLREKPRSRLPRTIRSVTLPAGPTATLEHRGAHAGLARAHRTLDRWLAAQGRAAAGPRWEVYITTPLATRDPAALRTAIYLPLEPRSRAPAR